MRLDLNPEWDQYLYVPVHSLSDRMVLEIMDYQHLTSACLSFASTVVHPRG